MILFSSQLHHIYYYNSGATPSNTTATRHLWRHRTMPESWRRSCRRNTALYTLLLCGAAACVASYLTFHSRNPPLESVFGGQRAGSTPRLPNCPYSRAAVIDYLPLLAATVAVPAPAEWAVRKQDPSWVGNVPYPSWATWGDAETVPNGMTLTEARGMKIGPSALYEGIMYSLNNAINALPRAAPLDVKTSNDNNNNGAGASLPALEWGLESGAARMQPSPAQMAAALVHAKGRIQELTKLAFHPKNFKQDCRVTFLFFFFGFPLSFNFIIFFSFLFFSSLSFLWVGLFWWQLEDAGRAGWPAGFNPAQLRGRGVCSPLSWLRL